MTREPRSPSAQPRGPRASLRLLAALLLLPSAFAAGQEAYRFPYREGNFLRYRVDEGPALQDTSFLLSFGPRWGEVDSAPMLDTVHVMRTGPRVLDMLNVSLVTIDARGVLVSADSIPWGGRGGRLYEYIPTVSPPGDTLTLYNTHAHDSTVDIVSAHTIRILRRFDTTIAGSPTRACAMQLEGPDRREWLTIADGFGFVRMRIEEPPGSPYAEAHLSGAVIDGRRWNWDPLERHFMPLCVGDIHQARLHRITYPSSGGPTPGDTIIMLTDTVRSAGIHFGEEWYAFRNMTLRDEPGGTFQLDLGNPVTHKRLVYPAHAEPGCVVGWWRIADTSVANVLFKRSTSISLVPFAHEMAIFDGPETWEAWADGFGMYDAFTGCHGCMWSNTDDYVTLTYARICGTDYGTFVNAVSAPPLPGEAVLAPLWPNPLLRLGGTDATVKLTLAGRMPVTLAVYSTLGARVALLHEGALEAGEHVFQWSSGALSAGVYHVVLQTPLQRIARALAVR